MLNMQEEIRSGHLITAKTKKLWAIEIDLARRLMEVCQKHGLKIWADMGTLLGVVRHKGFIPWDDDIDFAMFREDFNKLCEIGKKEFSFPYYFQTIETDGIESYVVRLRNCNTTFITDTDPTWINRNFGIFVDVFVLDAMPENKEAFEKLYKKVKFRQRIRSNYLYLDTAKVQFRTRLAHCALKSFFSIYPIKSLNSQIKKLLESNAISNSKQIAAIDFHAVLQHDIRKVERRNREWYDETIMLPFEDILMPVPKGYKEVLTAIYGDWRTPVKGGSIHTADVIDCDRPYKDVIREFHLNRAR